MYIPGAESQICFSDILYERLGRWNVNVDDIAECSISTAICLASSLSLYTVCYQIVSVTVNQFLLARTNIYGFCKWPLCNIFGAFSLPYGTVLYLFYCSHWKWKLKCSVNFSSGDGRVARSWAWQPRNWRFAPHRSKGFFVSRMSRLAVGQVKPDRLPPSRIEGEAMPLLITVPSWNAQGLL
jgi:hypothetical protein